LGTVGNYTVDAENTSGGEGCGQFGKGMGMVDLPNDGLDPSKVKIIMITQNAAIPYVVI